MPKLKNKKKIIPRAIHRAVKSSYAFQTKPFHHQDDCWTRSRDLPAFAFLMEQGTGKTWVGINTAGYLFEQNKIDALVVFAPNEGDVPQVWIEQLAVHLPKRIKYTACRTGSGMLANDKRLFKYITDPTISRLDAGLRVITINVEGVRVKGPLFKKALLTFMRQFRVLLIGDESHHIKSMGSSQTKGALKLAANADYRRIASGTPITNGPFDAYSQFYFLDPNILGYHSEVAYKAQYCEMLPSNHGLVKWTADKMGARFSNPAAGAAFAAKMAARIQLPARNVLGQIIYKNTDELAKKIAPYSYRVLKKDCLDLPDKLYVKRYIELTPKQREIYEEVKREVVAEFVAEGQLTYITSSLAIIRLLRLQQVLCNHYAPDPDPDQPKSPAVQIERPSIDKKGKMVVTNPRMLDVLAVIDEALPDAKGIIWCRHHPEIREVVSTLRHIYGHESVVELHGDITGKARIAARHMFQDLTSKVRWLVGQIRSGVGIDLFAATWEYFYSNDYSLSNRLQAEDRAHRIGQTKNVTIFDAVAKGTQDEKVINILRGKLEVAEVIVGDNPRNWI